MAKWGGPSGNLTWPLNPSNKQKKAKTKTKEETTANKENQKTNQKQNKTNKEGLGPSKVALWATSPDPQTLHKNKKNKPKKTQHITHNQTKETQNNKNKNQNTATWFIKQQQEEVRKKAKKNKTNKRKGQHKKERVLKASAKNLKTCRKIVFFQTSPVNFWYKTLLRTPKTPMCTISVSVFVFCIRSGFRC